MRPFGEAVTVERLLRDTAALVRPLAGQFLGWTAGLTMLNVALSLAGHEDAALVAVGVLIVVAQRHVVLSALVVAGYPRSTLRLGFVHVFVLQLLVAAGYLLGALLFIVPFVVLFVRWWTAVPIMATTGIGPVAALKQSWTTTARAWRPVAGLAGVVLFVMTVAAAAAIAHVADVGVDVETDPLSFGFILTEVIYNTLTLLITLSTVAVFLALRDRSDALGEVFA